MAAIKSYKESYDEFATDNGNLSLLRELEEYIGQQVTPYINPKTRTKFDTKEKALKNAWLASTVREEKLNGDVLFLDTEMLREMHCLRYVGIRAVNMFICEKNARTYNRMKHFAPRDANIANEDLVSYLHTERKYIVIDADLCGNYYKYKDCLEDAFKLLADKAIFAMTFTFRDGRRARGTMKYKAFYDLMRRIATICERRGSKFKLLWGYSYYPAMCTVGMLVEREREPKRRRIA